LEDNNIQAGLLSLLYAVGYSTGPIIGGALVSTSWRWVFGINLPCCALSMILIFLFLRKGTKGPQPSRRLSYLPKELSEELLTKAEKNGSLISDFLRIDTIGAILFVACGILILLGLSWGSTEQWNEARVIVSLVIGGVLLLLFIGWEWMVEHSTDHLVREFEGRHRDQEAGDSSAPELGLRQGVARFAPKWAYTTDAMIPMNMFRSFDVVATSLAAMVSGMIMLGIFYFVSVQYVIVQGKSPTEAGVGLLYFAPGIVRTLSMTRCTHRLTIYLRV
jgi:MFS family permease